MQKRAIKGLALAIALSGLSVNAFAVGPGFYMGLMTGPATNGAGDVQVQVANSPTTTPASSKSSQFGTRIFLGNKFNSYASFEAGISLFTGIKFDTKNVDTCDAPQIRVRDFDAVFKGEFNAYKFTLYGKAGAALAYVNESGSLDPDLSSDCGDSKNTTNLKPTFSVGASYDFNQNWVMDLSMNTIMVGGKANSVTLYALGLSYHFVDQYCGQFLC